MSAAVVPVPETPSASSSHSSVSGYARVVQLLADSTTAARSRIDLFRNLLSLLSREELVQLSERWYGSADTYERQLGLIGLLFANRSGLAASAVEERSSIQNPELADLLASAIAALKDTSSSTVSAIGRLALNRSVPLPIRHQLAESLYAIHSAATLPFAAELLDDPDYLIRGYAVMAFSAFAVGMRTAWNGADRVEAMDEVMNPGRKKTNSSLYDTDETRRFVRFGPIPEQDEPEISGFWREWFRRQRRELGL